MSKQKKSAYQEICDRFERPDVQVFAEDSYRAILWRWHYHDGACTSQLSGTGRTLDEACKALLRHADAPRSRPTPGYCSDACFYQWPGHRADGE